MSKQIQEQLQIRMKMLDDVFQNVIIALERLEIYLEKKRNNKGDLEYTAINSDRDLHDDIAIPPTENSFHLELQTQCMTLFYQTNFDKDKETFHKVIKYFLNDLLTWYGGRDETIPYNYVEKYFVPILFCLNRQVKNVGQISEVIKESVIDIDTDMKNLSEADKEKAVVEGFTAFTRATEIKRKSNEAFLNSEENQKKEFGFTSHKRGTTEEGYTRLKNAFKELYDNSAPIKHLDIAVGIYFPELMSIVTEPPKKKENQGGVSSDSSGINEVNKSDTVKPNNDAKEETVLEYSDANPTSINVQEEVPDDDQQNNADINEGPIDKTGTEGTTEELIQNENKTTEENKLNETNISSEQTNDESNENKNQ